MNNILIKVTMSSEISSPKDNKPTFVVNKCTVKEFENNNHTKKALKELHEQLKKQKIHSDDSLEDSDTDTDTDTDVNNETKAKIILEGCTIKHKQSKKRKYNEMISKKESKNKEYNISKVLQNLLNNNEKIQKKNRELNIQLTKLETKDHYKNLEISNLQLEVDSLVDRNKINNDIIKSYEKDDKQHKTHIEKLKDHLLIRNIGLFIQGLLLVYSTIIINI